MMTDTAHLLAGDGTRDRPFCPFAWRSCAIARTDAIRPRRKEFVREVRGGVPCRSGPNRPTAGLLIRRHAVPAPKPNLSSSIWLIVAGLVVITALGLFRRRRGGGGHRRDPLQPVPAVSGRRQGEAGHGVGQHDPRHADGQDAGRADATSPPCRCRPTSPSQLAKHNVEYQRHRDRQRDARHAAVVGPAAAAVRRHLDVRLAGDDGRARRRLRRAGCCRSGARRRSWWRRPT